MNKPIHEGDGESQRLLLLAHEPGAFYILSHELRAALNYAGWMPIGKGTLNAVEVGELLGRVLHRLTDNIQFNEDYALYSSKKSS